MRSDLEKYDLRGAVRSVEIVSLHSEEESGERVEKPFHTQRMAFNTQGHLTESSSFSPDGASFRMAYTYDAEGRLSETNYYDTGNVLSSRTLYRYDGQGRLERETNYNADGAEVDSKTFSYDAEGRKTEELVLHRASLEPEATQDYDTGGEQVEGVSCETHRRRRRRHGQCLQRTRRACDRDFLRRARQCSGTAFLRRARKASGTRRVYI
jgi:YD repeat-containing protein